MKEKLIQLISQVPELVETALACNHNFLPNYYIAGGAITQIIWNNQIGMPLLDKVKDIDIVYFAPGNDDSEKVFENTIASQLTHKIQIDVKNQANIHKWYPEKFGQVITPYHKTEQGIDSWLSAFAIGFRVAESGDIEIYAPYGLEDAFNLNVRPNKITITEVNYMKMTNSFKERWPKITVDAW